jgi:hypothetical protein
MSKEQEKVNTLYNEIREIIKLPDEKERHEKIKEVLSALASVGVTAISSSNDPQVAVSAYFGGFSAIAMMLGAIEIDKDNAGSVINYVQTVIGMCTHVLIKAEKGAKDGE